MNERTTLTITSTGSTILGITQHEETRIIPRVATIQDLIDTLNLCNTDDSIDQVSITVEDKS